MCALVRGRSVTEQLLDFALVLASGLKSVLYSRLVPKFNSSFSMKSLLLGFWQISSLRVQQIVTEFDYNRQFTFAFFRQLMLLGNTCRYSFHSALYIYNLHPFVLCPLRVIRIGDSTYCANLISSAFHWFRIYLIILAYFLSRKPNYVSSLN